MPFHICEGCGHGRDCEYVDGVLLCDDCKDGLMTEGDDMAVEYLCPNDFCRYIWKEPAYPGRCPECGAPAYWYDYPLRSKEPVTKKFTKVQRRVQLVVVWMLILAHSLLCRLLPWRFSWGKGS